MGLKMLVADDHCLFLSSLTEYIRFMEPEAQVSCASSFDEALQIMQGDESYDLVFLDYRMPGMRGIESIERWLSDYPDVPLAVMSGVIEPEEVTEAVLRGVSGYFPKTMSGADMLRGIRHIMSGGCYVPRNPATGELQPSFYAFPTPRPEKTDDIRLSPREKEVLSLLSAGLANKDIARQLSIEVVTVKLHIRSIFKKTGVVNRTQAALFAKNLTLH